MFWGGRSVAGSGEGGVLSFSLPDDFEWLEVDAVRRSRGNRLSGDYGCGAAVFRLKKVMRIEW